MHSWNPVIPDIEAGGLKVQPLKGILIHSCAPLGTIMACLDGLGGSQGTMG